MIGQVVALARNRGWEHDIVASFQLAVAVPSPRFRSINSVEICCSTDGDAWGLVMLQGFPVNTARSEETRKALQHLNQSFAPARLDTLTYPDEFIKYALTIDKIQDVEKDLGRIIDDATHHLDFACSVLRLVNWGGKSADYAVAHVLALETQ
jgi:hypothetical protein